jgi:hypothetical protein
MRRADGHSVQPLSEKLVVIGEVRSTELLSHGTTARSACPAQGDDVHTRKTGEDQRMSSADRTGANHSDAKVARLNLIHGLRLAATAPS